MKQHGAGEKNIQVRHLGIGMITSMIITLLLTAIGASMVAAGKLPETASGYIAMMVLFLGALGGAAAGGGKAKGKRLYACMVIALGYYVTLLAMTALFFGGQYKGAAVTALLILSGAFVASLHGQRRGEGRRLHKSKIRHR